MSRFFWAALVTLVAFALADVLAFRGLFIDRSLLLFALLVPAVALAGISASKWRQSVKSGLVALLVLTSLVSASTLYYQEAFYFVSTKSTAVLERLRGVPLPAVVLDGQYPEDVWRSPDQQASWGRRSFYGLYPEPFENLTGSEVAVYAVLDTEWRLWYRQWYGIEIFEFYQAASQNYPLIYSNGQADIFLISASNSSST